MSTRLTLALLLLAASLTGCGYKKSWVAADPMELTAKPKGYDMLVTRDGTDREHKVLGELVVSGKLEPSWALENSHDRIVDELRKEAIRKGADAVIGLKTSEMDKDGHTEMSVTGQLIIFTAPPPIASRN